MTALKTVVPQVFLLSPPVQIGDMIDGNELTYPYIIYDEASDHGAFFADNTEQNREVAWNVSIVNNTSTTILAENVIVALHNIGYEREMKHDLYQNKEYVKIMRFKGMK